MSIVEFGMPTFSPGRLLTAVRVAHSVSFTLFQQCVPPRSFVLLKRHTTPFLRTTVWSRTTFLYLKQASHGPELCCVEFFQQHCPLKRRASVSRFVFAPPADQRPLYSLPCFCAFRYSRSRFFSRQGDSQRRALTRNANV